MNFLQLVIKQMRQRALSTWLTLVSVLLGVALAIAIMVFQREGRKLFGQSDFGFDLIVGPKGSPVQLVLNSVYHLDKSPGNIAWSVYTDLARPRHPFVRSALPVAVGDDYKGFRVIGTLPHVFTIDHTGQALPESRVFQYRQEKRFEFAEGRPFHPEKFEAVIGADVAIKSDLKMGSKFKVSHGGSEDEHAEMWEVVGILKETKTAKDRVIIIPLISFLAIPQHEKAIEELARIEAMQEALKSGKPLFAPPPATKPAAKKEEHDLDHDHDHAHEKETKAKDEKEEHDHDHDHPPKPTTVPATAKTQAADDEHEGHDHEHDHAYHLNPDGTIHLHLEPEKWKISAVMVRSRGGFQNLSLKWGIDNGKEAMAVAPGMVMTEFYDTFLKGSSNLLLFIAVLVTVVAAVSILVSIYNSISARRREIAILRALGATRAKVLALICLEAGLIGLLGGLLGIVAGHALSGAGSAFLESLVGQGINWMVPHRQEWLYLATVVVLAVIAGLVPAMKAYRTPVATNLVAGV